MKHKYSKNTLEEKIIKELHRKPKKTTPLLRRVNGNSLTSIKKQDLYEKLLEMKREGKIYRKGEHSRPNGRAGINDFKWFLSSKYIFHKTVSEEIGLAKDNDNAYKPVQGERRKTESINRSNES